MKSNINEILKKVFERDFNNAKKQVEAESKQQPLVIMQRTYSNGLVTQKFVCLN